ncbi:hypothetical protein [Nonomuraea longicatena]
MEMQVRTLAALAAGVLLAGCGNAVTAAPMPPASRAVPGEVEVRITIARGHVTPPPGRVRVGRGRPVAITVTSDVSDELRVHGHDLNAPLPAGRPVTVRFTPVLSGLLPVETREHRLTLTRLAVG